MRTDSRRTVFIVGLCLLWMALLAWDVVPLLRGGYGWQWRYAPILDLGRIAPLILGIALYAIIALWLLRCQRVVGLLIWAALACIGLSLAAAYLRQDVLYRLYAVTVSGKAGGWHMAAMHIENWRTTLSNWPKVMAISVSFSTHMSISPPGMVMIYYLIRVWMEHFPPLVGVLAAPLSAFQCQSVLSYTDAQCASAWAGMLMPLWSSLTIFPLYQLGRCVWGGKVARWGVVWWPLTPSLLMFAPLPNIIYPLCSLLVIGLLWNGLSRNQMRWVLAAGVLMSVLSWITFTFLPLLLLAGLLTLGMYGLKTRVYAEKLAWHWPVQVGAWFGVGLTTAWIAFYAVSGLTVWDIWAEASKAHLALHRPYWPWLFLHLNDLFMFTGWPLVLAAGIGLWTTLSRTGRFFANEFRLPQVTEQTMPQIRRPDQSDVMNIAVCLTLIILNLSGTMRGEAGRILVFFSPWLMWMAAQSLSGMRRQGQVLTVLQGLTAITMVVCLHVLDAGSLTKPDFVLTGDRLAHLQPQVTLTTPVGSGLQLLGYDLSVPVGDAQSLELTLYWRAVDVVPQQTYIGFAHVLDAQTRTLLGQDDHALGRDLYPPYAWQLDEVIVDRYVLPKMPLDQVLVQVGVYTWPDLKRLPTPNDANDVIILTPP